MLTIEELAAINEHIEKAERKHPNFVKEIVDKNIGVSDAKCILENYRSLLRTSETADNVVLCECAEAMEAFVFGDSESAIDEYYDAIAAIVRAIRKIQTIANKG